MGRKSITFAKIDDVRIRRVCFKKRRIGLMKKAIQLSTLSGCEVELKIYNPEDKSLLHYQSEITHTFRTRVPHNENVKEYMKFYNIN